MPIISALFRNCSPKDVAAFIALDIGAGRQVIQVVSVSTGGFLFCYSV